MPDLIQSLRQQAQSSLLKTLEKAEADSITKANDYPVIPVRLHGEAYTLKTRRTRGGDSLDVFDNSIEPNLVNTIDFHSDQPLDNKGAALPLTNEDLQIIITALNNYKQ